MSSLIDWIKYPNDIQAGREHFRQHVKKAALYKVLCNKDTVAIRCRLVTELKAVAGEMALQEVKQLERQLDKLEPLPDELKHLEIRKSEIWRESQALKVELNFSDSKERRCEIAHKILDNFDEINDIWSIINHWHKTKTLPVPAPDPEEITETDPIKLYKMRNNLRANISKAKVRPDKIAKLRVWEKQLVEVENRLNQQI
jgi:TRAP-type uncharacterized transport system substrate-binding protein